MTNSIKEKISIRVSKQQLDEIDTYIKTSDTYTCRSDYIRELIKRNKPTTMELQKTGLTLHSKTFREIIKQLTPEDLNQVTKKTSSIIHSILQERKKKSLKEIRDLEVLSFISDLYQTNNMVKTLHYRIIDENIIMCISGDNLHSKTYTEYVKQEITNAMKPWFKLKNSSETPGNLILTFKTGRDEETETKYTLL